MRNKLSLSDRIRWNGIFTKDVKVVPVGHLIKSIEDLKEKGLEDSKDGLYILDDEDFLEIFGEGLVYSQGTTSNGELSPDLRYKDKAVVVGEQTAYAPVPNSDNIQNSEDKK